jgi:FO synthase
MYLQRKSRRGPTFREALLMHAVARLAYRELVPNVQVSWVKMGRSGVHQVLKAGANDVGGTLMDENISRAAGASHGQRMTEDTFREWIDDPSRPLVQRTTLYGRAVQPV